MVTLTLAQLREDLRFPVDGDGNPDTGADAQLMRVLATATAMVDKYAGGAPEPVANGACALLAAYLWDRPESPAYGSHAAILRNSGAASMLSPWRVRNAGVVG